MNWSSDSILFTTCFCCHSPSCYSANTRSSFLMYSMVLSHEAFSCCLACTSNSCPSILLSKYQLQPDIAGLIGECIVDYQLYIDPNSVHRRLRCLSVLRWAHLTHPFEPWLLLLYRITTVFHVQLYFQHVLCLFWANTSSMDSCLLRHTVLCGLTV